MRGTLRFGPLGCIALAGVLLLAASAARADTGPRYHIAHDVPLPGDEGWDYLTLDSEGHRLFIAHGTHVLVVDTEKLAVAGRIADTPGVHGIALAPELGRGYVSAGRAGLVEPLSHSHSRPRPHPGREAGSASGRSGHAAGDGAEARGGAGLPERVRAARRP